MRHRSRAFLAGSLGFTVAFVVACGGGNGLLTSNQAGSLNGQLSSISSALAAGDCSGAAAASQQFSNEVGSLPSNINTTLIENLGQGAATLSQLASRDCTRSTATTTTTPTTTSTPAPTTTTTTSTPTTTTTTSSPTTTTTTTSATNPTGTGTTSNGGAGLTTGGGGGGIGGGTAGGGGAGGTAVGGGNGQ